MRFARFFLPLALGVSLVGCQQYLRTPEDQARIDAEMREEAPTKEPEAMMIKESDPAPTDDATVKEEPKQVVDSKPTPVPEAIVQPVDGSYGAYSPSVLANGQKKVLFFHAAWCPVCKHADQQLTAWYSTHPFPISTYIVDYDTETALKQRYGVTYQHTYVLADGQGNALTVIQGPTDEELQDLLRS